MARKKKSATASEHPEQTHIEGMEPERNAKVHNAARAYRKVRDERIILSASEKTAKQKLIETMKDEGIEVYVDPSGYTVTVDTKSNVHLSAGEDEAGEE